MYIEMSECRTLDVFLKMKLRAPIFANLIQIQALESKLFTKLPLFTLSGQQDTGTKDTYMWESKPFSNNF